MVRYLTRHIIKSMKSPILSAERHVGDLAWGLTVTLTAKKDPGRIPFLFSVVGAETERPEIQFLVIAWSSSFVFQTRSNFSFVSFSISEITLAESTHCAPVDLSAPHQRSRHTVGSARGTHSCQVAVSLSRLPNPRLPAPERRFCRRERRAPCGPPATRSAVLAA